MAQRDSATKTEVGQAATGFDELLAKSTQQSESGSVMPSAAVGELLAVFDNGRSPLVAVHREAGMQGVIGRTTIDLHADHVGLPVVLLFEGGDCQRPIVVGVLRTERASVPSELVGAVDLSADGERLIVTARRELVLQCGRASITLRQDGTIRIVGERILSQATGPNRVQGGSIELN